MGEIDVVMSAVQLNVYDVMPNLSGANKVLKDWLGAGGAFHSAIVVYGQEWAFGGCEEGTGVFCTPPKAVDQNPFAFKETIEMGETLASMEEVAAIIDRLSIEWQGNTYDLTRRNCCDFAEAFSAELKVPVEFPPWVNRLAGAGAAVGDAGTAALMKAQQVNNEYRISE